MSIERPELDSLIRAARERAARDDHRRWRHLGRGTTYAELGRVWLSGGGMVYTDNARLFVLMREDAALSVSHEVDSTWPYGRIELARLQTRVALSGETELVIYRAELDEMLWARPTAEFEDGRFEEIL